MAKITEDMVRYDQPDESVLEKMMAAEADAGLQSHYIERGAHRPALLPHLLRIPPDRRG